MLQATRVGNLAHIVLAALAIVGIAACNSSTTSPTSNVDQASAVVVTRTANAGLIDLNSATPYSVEMEISGPSSALADVQSGAPKTRLGQYVQGLGETLSRE